MFKRYVLDWEDRGEYRNFQAAQLVSFSLNQFNIYPGKAAPVITADKPEELQSFIFGFPRNSIQNHRLLYNVSDNFIKINNGKNNQILASEIKKLFQHNRCIIPATGFYFFTIDPKSSQPYFCFTPFGLFSFAGIWAIYKNSITKKDEEVFCIITTKSNELMQKLNCPLSPVILKKNQEDLWLNKSTKDADLMELLTPFPTNEINAWPVKKRIVNSKLNLRSFIMPIGKDVLGRGWRSEPFLGTKRFLCSKCCVNKYLKLFVSKKAKIIQKCNVCRKKTKCIQVEDNIKLIKLFRGLHRLIFDDINDSMAYVHDASQNYFLERGVYEANNPILKNTSFRNFHKVIRKNLYKGNQNVESHIYLLEYLLGRCSSGKELADNYYEIKGYFEKPLKLISAEYIKNIDKILDSNNKMQSFNQNILKAKEIIKKSISDKLLTKKTIFINKKFYRARLGYDKTRYIDVRDYFFEGYPYIRRGIGAPPSELTPQGRLNVEGVPILYLGSDEHTAICEIRPEPGAYVSLAVFKPNEKNFKIIDLREINFLDFFESEENLITYYILNDISKKFAQPALSNTINRYKVTQIVSEVIAELGYDGILYNSALTTGYNLAIFESSKFSYVEESASIFVVDKVKFNYNLFLTPPVRTNKNQF